jgi:hypothetical protein
VPSRSVLLLPPLEELVPFFFSPFPPIDFFAPVALDISVPPPSPLLGGQYAHSSLQPHPHLTPTHQRTIFASHPPPPLSPLHFCGVCNSGSFLLVPAGLPPVRRCWCLCALRALALSPTLSISRSLFCCFCVRKGDGVSVSCSAGRGPCASQASRGRDGAADGTRPLPQDAALLSPSGQLSGACLADRRAQIDLVQTMIALRFVVFCVMIAVRMVCVLPRPCSGFRFQNVLLCDDGCCASLLLSVDLCLYIVILSFW